MTNARKLQISLTLVVGLVVAFFAPHVDTIPGVHGRIAKSSQLDSPLGKLLLPRATASSFGTVQLSPSYTATFAAASSFFTPPGTAGNICWSLYGSSSKTIQVTQISISRQSSGAGADQYAVTKRSSAISGGSGAAVTSASLDSTNSAATAVVTTYTAAPTGGTSAGVVASGITPQSAIASNLVLYQCSDLEQALTLRGTGQGVDITGLTTLAGSIQVTVKYQEF